MEEVDNVLRILIETREAIDTKDSYRIKLLSDQTTHTATIDQDPDNIVVAVLVYSISKIIEKKYFQEIKGWNEFYKSLIKNLDLSIKALKEKDIEEFRNCEKNIRTSISNIDSRLSDYIQDIFRKAKINKASKIHEHGLSIERTAELLGIDLWDLSNYVGQSNIQNAKENVNVKQRIEIAEELFS